MSVRNLALLRRYLARETPYVISAFLLPAIGLLAILGGVKIGMEYGTTLWSIALINGGAGFVVGSLLISLFCKS